MYNFSKKNTILLLTHYSLLLQKQWEMPYLVDNPIIQERMFQFEKNIIKAFGLPLSPKHILYLYNQTNIGFLRDYDMEWLYDKMSLRAEKYLLTSVRTGNQWMEMMLDNNHYDPFEILPELKIPVNHYTLFLYHSIKKGNGIKTGEIFREFNLLKNERNITGIYLLCLDKNYESNTIYRQLINSGLKYLPRYLHWYHNYKR